MMNKNSLKTTTILCGLTIAINSDGATDSETES
jgi:hypothetical protein